MADVRIATIGSSAIAERFLDAVDKVDGIDFVGAYSRSLEKAHAFGEPRGATVFFDDLDSLACSSDIDAVYVASPNALHALQSQRMLAGGKHVLCEKSLASNERDARASFAAAHENGVVLMEAMRNIHDPGFATIRDMLGKLGTIREATIRFAKITSRMARLEAGELPNVFDPRVSEDALLDIGVYTVEPMIALFGEPEQIKAFATVRDISALVGGSPHNHVDLGGEVICSYGDMVASLSYGKVHDEMLPSQIAGEKATLLWESECNPTDVTLFVHENKGMVFGAEQTTGERIHIPTDDNDMVYEIADFIAAIRGEKGSKEMIAECERTSIASLAVMDEVRRQIGVTFPADEEEETTIRSTRIHADDEESR